MVAKLFCVILRRGAALSHQAIHRKRTHASVSPLTGRVAYIPGLKAEALRTAGNAPAFALADVAPDGSLNETVVAATQPIGGGASLWHRSYDFDSALGARSIDAGAILAARARLDADAALRGRYYLLWFGSGGIAGAVDLVLWRREWCAIDEPGERRYARCIEGRR